MTNPEIRLELSEHDALLLFNLVKRQAAVPSAKQQSWLHYWQQLAAQLQINIESSYCARKEKCDWDHCPNCFYYMPPVDLDNYFHLNVVT
ncbi:MAG TPA: hypothetical protein VEC93_21255 [Anaerolineae bacterium]|nr:hypothetical protein [Anaerolineae bacterium]